MPRPATNPSWTNLDDEFDERDLSAPSGKKRPAKPEQPTIEELVAATIVRRLFRENLDILRTLRRPSCAIVVELPHPAWVAEIERAWRYRIIRLGLHGAELAPQQGRRDKEDYGRFFVIKRSTEEKRTSSMESDEPALLAKLFAEGRSVVAFAVNPEKQLPRGLLRTADLRLRIDGARPAEILAALRRLTGSQPSTRLDAASAARANAVTLCMAWRQGNTADEYLERLLRLVSSDRTNTGPSLDDLAGMDEAREWGLSLARDLRDYRAGKLAWSMVDRGVLLVGPSGVGKTTFARRLATSCGVPLIVASLSAWQASGEGHLGTLLKAMRGSFSEARASAPVILFIDEVDSFGNRTKLRGESRSYEMQVINGLLEELDGLQGREGVVVIAACNDARGIDPAITRAGRLDRTIEIRMPDEAALAGILRFHLGDELLTDDLGQIAAKLPGQSGADVERLVRLARRRARYAGRELLLQDLAAELSATEWKASRELRRRAAVHEAGHAVVAELQRPGQVQRLAVGRRGDDFGFAEYDSEREVVPDTLEEFSRRLQRTLAGRAAEILAFGDASGGSGGGQDSDLGRATWLALTAITTLGLDPERRSLVWLGARDPLGAASLLSIRPDLQKAVNRMLTAAQDAALRLLSRRKGALLKIAETLDQRGTLTGDEIRAILREDGAGAVPAPASRRINSR